MKSFEMEFFLYFKSSYCFCDNNYGAYGTTTTCNMACTGDSSELCGGSMTNQIYYTNCRKQMFFKIFF